MDADLLDSEQAMTTFLNLHTPQAGSSTVHMSCRS